LFDFDNSGEIDVAEMFMSINSAVTVTAKIHGIKAPYLREIRTLSEHIFELADIDKSQAYF